MTAASADRPNDRATFLSHYPLQVGAALVLIDLGSHLYLLPYQLRLISASGATILYVVWMYSNYRHYRAGLCERCAKDTPLDPKAAVAKQMRWLKLTHWLMDTKWRWLPLGVAFAAAAGGYVKFGLFSLGLILTPVFWAAMLGPAVLLHIHNPLQPWCPFCRWDDGGDEEPSPEPTPDPSIAPERVES